MHVKYFLIFLYEYYVLNKQLSFYKNFYVLQLTNDIFIGKQPNYSHMKDNRILRNYFKLE